MQAIIIDLFRQLYFQSRAIKPAPVPLYRGPASPTKCARSIGGECLANHRECGSVPIAVPVVRDNYRADFQDVECLGNFLVGVAGFEPATPSLPRAVTARTGGELLRDFFGTLRADFGILCPFCSHLRNSAAKRQSEERANYQRLLARRSE